MIFGGIQAPKLGFIDILDDLDMSYFIGFSIITTFKKKIEKKHLNKTYLHVIIISN